MKMNRKRKKMGEIPTSSTSDVAFLLLVFFLSTTKFDIKKGLGLVLPPAASNAEKKVKLKNDNLTKVLIKNDGSIRLKAPNSEEDINFSQLKAKIKALVKDNHKMVISLTTQRNAKYDYMVQALDYIQDAGATKISLSTN